MTIEELKHYLVINKDNLEEELIRQPQLFAEVADYYAEAVNKREVSKQVLEQLDADLAGQFRSNSIEKVTATQVSDYVNSHHEHNNQYRIHLQYKLESDKLQGLKDAFAQRSSMLRDLVTLYNTGYWGTGINLDKDMIKSYGERYQKRNQQRE